MSLFLRPPLVKTDVCTYIKISPDLLCFVFFLLCLKLVSFRKGWWVDGGGCLSEMVNRKQKRRN